MSDSFAIPWTVAHQAPRSVGFPRQEYWSGLPFPSLEHLADSEIEPRSPATADSTTEPPGKATMYCIIYLFVVLIICYLLLEWRASQVVLVVKNPCANAGDIRYTGSILGLGRSLEKELATHSSILAWKIPWTAEPDGRQSMGSLKSQTLSKE